MEKKLFAQKSAFKAEKKKEPILLSPSHFLYLSCPFLSLGDLLPPSPLTFPSPDCILRFSLSLSYLFVLFSLTHLFRSLYRLTSFSSFLRSSINVLLRVCVYAFSPISYPLPFLQSPYKRRVCDPIETRRHENLLGATRAMSTFLHYILYAIYRISFPHCFIMNSYVLRYIYFFFYSSSFQDILCVK